MRHPLILPVWLTFICCVIVGSLAPATSPLMVAVASLHIYDKVQHFGAYLVLAFLPAIGFRDRHRGIVAVISIFALGVLLEAGQHFSAGRCQRVLAGGAAHVQPADQALALENRWRGRNQQYPRLAFDPLNLHQSVRHRSPAFAGRTFLPAHCRLEGWRGGHARP